MKKSKTAIDRQEGKYQVDEQRESILAAAEKLLLQNGLDKTKMIDIAAEASITKMTLYRYFPNIDAIAVEVQVRMLNKIASTLELSLEDIEASLQSAKDLSRLMIRNFDTLRDAYRYMGMFDSIYLDKPIDTAQPQQTKEQLKAISLSGLAQMENNIREHPHGSHFNVIMSSVFWFLEKMASRGELTWSDDGVPLENHLMLFEEMIQSYIDRCLDEQERASE